jgi:hypothetical protein
MFQALYMAFAGSAFKHADGGASNAVVERVPGKTTPALPL